MWIHKKWRFWSKMSAKTLLLIEKIGAPWGLWHFSSNYTGTSWLYMANCRVFEIFENIQKIFHIFCIFWSNFKIFPLAFEASKPKNNVQKCKIHELHTFYLLIFFFRFLMSFFSSLRFGGLYLTKFGNLDFQSSLVVSTDPSLDL